MAVFKLNWPVIGNHAMAVFKSKMHSGTVNPLMPFAPHVPSANMPGLFTRADQEAAMAEGWFVGWDEEGDAYDILDNLSLTFATPAEARAHVERQADAGSDLHERALAFMVALTIKGER